MVPKVFDAQPYNCKDNPDMDLSKICHSLRKIRLQKHCDIWFSVVYTVLQNTGNLVDAMHVMSQSAEVTMVTTPDWHKHLTLHVLQHDISDAE